MFFDKSNSKDNQSLSGKFLEIKILDKVSSKTLEITIFIAFVGPENTIIDKWSKRFSLNLKDQPIVPFSLAIEGLQSNITEGRTGSSYKALIGLE